MLLFINELIHSSFFIFRKIIIVQNKVNWVANLVSVSFLLSFYFNVINAFILFSKQSR